MKKLILILAVLLTFGCSEKEDNTPIEIQSVEKGLILMNINYKVKRDINLAIYPQGYLPIHTRVGKGLYVYSGEKRTIIFDYEFGKLIVE